MNFLGWILLLVGVAIWWTGRMIGRLLSFIFCAIWWVACLPFRAIYWIFSEGTDHCLDSMQLQWRRDKSIFLAKMLITMLVLFLAYKATHAITLLFHHAVK
jgi:hypothetical protein